MDQNPLAALSLLSLAASQQTRPSPNGMHGSLPLSPTISSVSQSSMSSPINDHAQSRFGTLSNTLASPPSAPRSTSVSRPSGQTTQKHRRLSSTGQRGRRLSEATAATASALVRGVSASSTSGIPAAQTAHSLSSSPPAARPLDSIQKYVHPEPMDPDEVEMATSANGKKKVIYRCETCSKAYRHPNCLLKHRWEHSPHWREASKFLLSKHQQVQLLEAAAILSHITPGDAVGDPTASNARGTSLPEDRSLWPSYLSGGVLPIPPGQEHKAPNKTSGLSVSKESAVAVEEISSGEDDEPRDRDSGYGSGGISGFSSSSLPPSSTMPVNTPSLGPHQSYRDKSSSPNPISPGTSIPAPGTFGMNGGMNTNAFHYGSVGNNSQDQWSNTSTTNEQSGRKSSFVPSQSVGHKPFAGSGTFTGTRTMPYPTSTTAAAGRSRSRSITSRHTASFTPIPPPPFQRTRPVAHAHKRASSSISSSYTRSSIRGDGDDEEDDDDEGFILDVDEPFMSPKSTAAFGAGSSFSRSAFSGSTPNSFTAPQQMYQSGTFGRPSASVLHERDERILDDDGDDTVDEESLEGDGAGMEIDTMEL